MTYRPTIDCDAVRSHLYLYLGGELEDGPRRGTEEHLDGCASCRDELTVARRSRDVYLAAGVSAVAEADDISLWPGVRSRLYSEGLLGGAPASTAPVPLRPVRSWTWPAVAAAAAAVLALVPLLGDGAGDVARPPAVVETSPQPGDAVTPTPVVHPAGASSAPALATGESGLRPVLRGQQSLAERELERLREQARNGTGTPPQDPSLYDVVNGRRKLR